MEKKYCQICGQPSGMYPLCKKHMEMKQQNLVVKNEKTGKWELIEKSEPKKERCCIVCGAESNQMLFCRKCYYKYKDKELIIKITNCKDMQILDEAYEGKYICNDGHIVKSLAERLIDDFLFKEEIKHIYEKTLVIDNEESHDLHPDFTLPDFDNGKPIYIEHWGFGKSNKEYQRKRNYKIEIYEKMGLTVIQTTSHDLKDMNASLERKLKHFKTGKIN